ncbi:hypothetical protein EPN42_11115 [bacterium]|nr:MAG: hypothetical protein EPN42_11115 [bacterium]
MSLFTQDDLIDSYSRTDAIDDGVLIDVSAAAREFGIRYPVAMTRAAWTDCVEWTEADDRRKGTVQDETGRLADVLAVLGFTLRRSRAASASNRTTFEVMRTTRAGSGRLPQRVVLECICGPGDDVEPALTILLPGED